MKNKMLVLVLMLALVFVASIRESVAKMSWETAITSPQMAKQFAVENCDYAWAEGWSQSMVPSPNNAKWLYSQDPMKLGSMVASQSFSMDVSDISKPMNRDVEFYVYGGGSFNLMLHGYCQTAIVQGPDGTCHAAESVIKLELPESMVFKTGEKGLSQAFVRVKDENGNIINCVYLPVTEDGDMTYDTSLLGKMGELVMVRYVNGTQVSSCLDIKTGIPVPLFTVNSQIVPQVSGMVEVSDDGDILVFVESTNNVCSAMPFALMTVTKPGFHLVIAISSEGEIADGFWIREANSEDKGTYQKINPQSPWFLFSSTGKWWTTFTWPRLQGPNVPVANQYPKG